LLYKEISDSKFDPVREETAGSISGKNSSSSIGDIPNLLKNKV